MNELILELANNFFIKRYDKTKLSIIAHYHYQLQDVLDTYDSLKLIDKHNTSVGVQWDFEYIN